MKNSSLVASALVLLAACGAAAQVQRIVIPAGTPEDQEIQAITNETDAAKRIAMLQAFVEKFAANPQAVAYGDWQLSQQYLSSGDNAKALEFGAKALAVQPNNFDLLVAVAGVAQQMKLNDKVVDCSVHGGAAWQAIAKQPRPDGMSDAEFAAKVKDDQNSAQQSHEYLEVAGLNAISAETDPKKRMSYIEQYTPAYPDSRYEEQVMQLAVYSLGQLNDTAKLASFSEKALAANPNSVPMLVLLANALVESSNPAHVSRAQAYAQKGLDLVKSQAGGDAAKQRLYSGLAHSALGYALLKQEKTASAITELKAGAEELKDNPDAYSAVLYRLGFAYAKTNKLADAKAALTEAAKIDGPYQAPARDLLGKVEAGAAKSRK